MRSPKSSRPPSTTERVRSFAGGLTEGVAFSDTAIGAASALAAGGERQDADGFQPHRYPCGRPAGAAPMAQAACSLCSVCGRRGASLQHPRGLLDAAAWAAGCFPSSSPKRKGVGAPLGSFVAGATVVCFVSFVLNERRQQRRQLQPI